MQRIPNGVVRPVLACRVSWGTVLQMKAKPPSPDSWRPPRPACGRHQELAATLLQVKAERPQWYLAVVCGALLRVVEEASRRAAEYMGFLEKGQLPPARLTLTSFTEDLCLEGEPWFGRSSIVLFGTLPPAAFLAAVLVQVV